MIESGKRSGNLCSINPGCRASSAFASWRLVGADLDGCAVARSIARNWNLEEPRMNESCGVDGEKDGFQVSVSAYDCGPPTDEILCIRVLG